MSAMKGQQVRIVAQPYLRATRGLDCDTDLRSCQTPVNVSQKDGVPRKNVDVRALVLMSSDLARGCR
jgi:hypothetical protein